MAIKGLKEALAKKRAQQQPAREGDDAVTNAMPTAPTRPTSNKPPKRSAGRGR